MISWNDLEMKVVGNEEVDIDRLKEMTQYKGCNANHDVVKRFWKVLASFDNEDKKRYLRFVWGRTRLPPKEETDIE
jgi:HECT-domain (ubiquitin-transferase)